MDVKKAKKREKKNTTDHKNNYLLNKQTPWYE